MKIQIPENINLNNCSEQFILIIKIHPERFSFFLYNPVEKPAYFYYRIPKNKPSDAFSCFRDVFFDNEFFTLPFKKVFILNYTPAFTYVPALLFEEKDKEEYMRFLFSENTGKILCQTIQKPDMVVIHEMPEEIYEFFQRSFVDGRIIHHTAPLIAYFQNKGQLVNGNRMIINKQDKGMDILCFSRDTLLLSNHFTCSQLSDEVYYALFIWRQLKFSQLKDFIYVMENETGLVERLKNYVRNVVPVDWIEAVPFEITALTLCEL
jgi:hypothetical protein